MRVLLVEDDELLGDGLRSGLMHLGSTVDWVRDGEAARTALRAERFDVTVLDLGLPRLSGLDVLRGMRARGDRTPVLVLTARDTLQDKISGLDAGADDYLVKPADIEELAARLRALVRRAQGIAAPVLCIGGVELDPAARTVRRDGNLVELSAREFALLETLMTQAGRALTRSQLEAGMYGWEGGAESNTVEVHIHHLRRKLGADLIRTLRGVGYMIERAPAH
ncbi:MAG: response regulator transcription factor [Rhodocyclaceae bacterium]|nr:response regulator transcription factor [Rhodocyclaceae bacterium]MBX3668070.1 response regulator transcription factor [Rhodocyclaceae bacterium]